MFDATPRRQPDLPGERPRPAVPSRSPSRYWFKERCRRGRPAASAPRSTVCARPAPADWPRPAARRRSSPPSPAMRACARSQRYTDAAEQRKLAEQGIAAITRTPRLANFPVAIGNPRKRPTKTRAESADQSSGETKVPAASSQVFAGLLGSKPAGRWVSLSRGLSACPPR